MVQEAEAFTFDVVVVGGGGSGLAAAVSAAEHGARVVVLEKQPEVGGVTALAVGSFTTSGTRLQRLAGIEDNPEDHIEDAAKFAPAPIEARNNPEQRAWLLRHAADTWAWLDAMGLSFHGPVPEPPNRVARMHNVVPGARAYIHTLHKRLLKLGGTVVTLARVVELLREDGRVAGVIAETPQGRQTYRAARGVVLAAGDYASAPDLLARFKGEAFGGIDGIYQHANGDGHRLCEALGIPLINMDVTYGPELRFVPPQKLSLLRRLPAGGWIRTLMGWAMPYVPKPIMNAIIKRELVTWQHPEDKLFTDGAILVNQQGARFCNETATPQRETAIAKQPGKVAWLLLDARLCARYSEWPHYISTAPEIAYAYVDDYLRLRPDVAVAGKSLDEVAAARKMEPTTLKDTVEQWNRYARGETPDAFGREGDAEPYKEGRWVLLGPAKAYFTITEGSPAVNLDLQVLDAEGRPVPGLYAIGQNGMGGQILWGHGLHIAWALTSGRMAGKALAQPEA